MPKTIEVKGWGVGMYAPNCDFLLLEEYTETYGEGGAWETSQQAEERAREELYLISPLFLVPLTITVTLPDEGEKT